MLAVLLAQVALPDPGYCQQRFTPDTECGVIMVPEDWTNLTGREIPVLYVRFRAGPGSAGTEPVFHFAGGPGQPGTDRTGLLAGFDTIPVPRDFIFIDTRGTGASNGLMCSSGVADQPAAAFGHVFNPRLFRACAARLAQQANLSRYTTADIVQDVEALRQHLGYPQIIVWGESYGTRVAQEYLRAHPTRVLAAILDGVVPHAFLAPMTYARTAQQSFDRVVADCRASAACRDSFPRIEKDLRTVLARLDAAPVEVTVRTQAGVAHNVMFSRGDFVYGVRGMLYNGGLAVRLPGMLRRAAEGNLTAFAQLYYQRAAGFANVATGMHFAVFCAEDIPHIPAGRAAGLNAGTFIGDYVFDQYRDVCTYWPTAPVAPPASPASGTMPVLLLSGYLDPVTPPETAERASAGYPNHRHIVARRAGHGTAFGCPFPAVLHLLRTGTVEGGPPVCEDQRGLW